MNMADIKADNEELLLRIKMLTKKVERIERIEDDLVKLTDMLKEHIAESTSAQNEILRLVRFNHLIKYGSDIAYNS
jgi:hypothetical protein